MTWSVALRRSVRGRMPWRLRRRRAGHGNLNPVLQLDLARGHDLLTGLQPAADRDLVVPARPGLDRRAHRLEDRLALGVLAVLTDHIDAVAIERVLDCGLRHHHCTRLWRQ